MLFYSFFKTLLNQQVTVHLKNNIQITGNLVSVDQFLNIKLDTIQTLDSQPQLASLKNAFIRGSVVRYVELPSASVDTVLLQDAARKESQQESTKVA